MANLISLYVALVEANVPLDKAAAVVKAMEREHAQRLATKEDLTAHIRRIELRLTLRFGAMLAASFGLTVALVKVLP